MALVLAGCAGGTLPGEQVALPSLPRASQPTVPAASREHQRILAAYGGAYSDSKLEAMVAQTVERLVAASGRPDAKYKVTILNSPAVNAFALPSGQIYVTRGLLALANDNSELASVLAHEMAHVVADHAAMRANQARHAAVVSAVVSDVLSDPMAGALALAKSKIALASFSRAQELEADAIGVGIAARAGYDPYGAARFLDSMGRNADLKAGGKPADPGVVDVTASHPATPERVSSAQLNARQYSAPGAGERDRDSYLARVDGLVYGEDPAEGFVRGRRFIHPRLGFTFTAPEGFSLDNTAQAVLGVKDGGAQAMRLDVVRIPAEQTLKGYLTSGWLTNVNAGSVRELTINGFPAATATAAGDQWSFRLYVLRFGSDTYRFIFATKQHAAEADRHFRASIETFRRLSLAEIKGARPLRVKIVTVKPGDTVESLAAHYMSHADQPVVRFRVLNGLSQTARLRPGESVKVVVE
ncbi:MAG TPA: M48 family metalloprotease [Xanthobacteraceae bacterium]|nr:M48 family metalloprotease [Xanthobacteraceae bacterium]